MSQSLVALNTFKDFLGIPHDTDTENARLQMFLDAAVADCANYIKRKLILEAIVEVFDGDGESVRYVRNQHIVAAPTIDWYDGSQWITNYPGTYNLAFSWNDTGRVRFTNGGYFMAGIENWRINYQTGYSAATIPGDLNNSIMAQAQRLRKRADSKEGMASESIADQTVTYDLSKLPESIKRVWDAYKVKSYG